MSRLLVCLPPNGGVCHYTYSLADALQSRGEKTTVVAHDYLPYELAGLEHRHQVKSLIHTSDSRFGRLMDPFINLRKLLVEARDSQIVHYQWPMGPRTSPMFWKALKRRGKRIVYTAHNIVPHEAGNTQEAHVGWLYSNADAVIVHGDKLKEKVIKEFGVADRDVYVSSLGNYNFIADRFSKWNRKSARESLGWNEHERIVLFFGFIRPYKGLDNLITACSIVKNRHPELAESLRLLIAGANLLETWTEGDYDQRLDAAGMAAQTKSVVDYIALEDIGRYFMAADVIALPYKSGSQSAILQLAYSFARPVVVTNVGSIDEVVQNGITGLVVPPNEPEAFADALGQLLSNPAEAQAMGCRGRQYAETKLSWDKIAQRTLDIYDAVLQEPNRTHR